MTPAVWPLWSPQIRGVDYQGGRLRPDACGHVIVPGGVRLPFHIDAVDEAQLTWRWTVDLGVFSMVLDHEVHPGRAGAGTTVVIAAPPPVAQLYALACRPALKRLVSKQLR